MSFELPPDLAAALESLAEGVPGRQIAERAQAISAHYRQDRPSHGVIEGELDAIAYALTRLPATYAAVSAALAAMLERAPDFRPASVADVGCGPATASLAALSTFDSIETLDLIDGNAAMLELARRLLPSGAPTATLRQADLRAVDPAAADLVIAAYVLTEAPEEKAMAIAVRLWNAARGALVIVEPGTPRAWGRIVAVRSTLISNGARIAAPCPHEAACPLAAPDWCHFSQRLARRRAHRMAKGADVPYEDEKFTYLVALKPGVELDPPQPRVLAPPIQEKAGLRMKLCAPSGDAVILQAPRREKVVFRTLRGVRWGDTLDL